MRYYYDCSIKAAYMSKEFGVILNWDGNQTSYNDSKSAHHMILYSMMHYDSFIENNVDKYYVHPDSDHIFAIIHGDVIIDYLGNPTEVTSFIMAIMPKKNYKILQRGNKPFLPPLTEAPNE